MYILYAKRLVYCYKDRGNWKFQNKKWSFVIDPGTGISAYAKFEVLSQLLKNICGLNLLDDFFSISHGKGWYTGWKILSLILKFLFQCIFCQSSGPDKFMVEHADDPAMYRCSYGVMGRIGIQYKVHRFVVQCNVYWNNNWLFLIFKHLIIVKWYPFVYKIPECIFIRNYFTRHS